MDTLLIIYFILVVDILTRVSSPLGYFNKFLSRTPQIIIIITFAPVYEII